VIPLIKLGGKGGNFGGTFLHKQFQTHFNPVVTTGAHRINLLARE